MEKQVLDVKKVNSSRDFGILPFRPFAKAQFFTFRVFEAVKSGAGMQGLQTGTTCACTVVSRWRHSTMQVCLVLRIINP